MILGTLAAAALLAGCKEKEEELGAPSIKVNPAELTFTQESGAESVEVTATRDWTAESDAEWAKVEPASGAIGTSAVTVTVLENTETDRTANITFRSTNGTVTTKLAVKQAGPGGAVEDTYVYFNNFDKTAASKGSDGWDTWLDSFDGWKNETGSGISSVTYTFESMSARTSNGGSDSQYSDYAGSGTNYLWFGSGSPYIRLSNISLPSGVRNYTLSFGGERNEYKVEDNTFSRDEFKVYISNDGTKWVELEYTFPNGAPNRRWDLASSTFTLPEGTSALYIHIASSMPSAYLMDDLKLATSSAAGTEIDFSKGSEIGGGSEPVSGSIADVIAAALNTPVSTEGVVAGIYKSGVVITDGKDNLLVYNDKSNFTAPELSIGDKVSVSGTRAEYGKLPQIKTAYENISKVSSGNVVDYPEPQVVDASNIDSFDRTACTYMTYTGTLSISGNYYNVALDGTTVQGSLSYPLDELNLAQYQGKAAKYVGYFCGGDNEKYLNMLVVKVEGDSSPFLTVSKDNLSVSAEGGSVTFDVNSNVKWTVSSDNGAFTVSPSNGENNGTVTVTVAANDGSEARSATVTVTPDSGSGLQAKTVTISQSAPSTGAEVIDLLTADLFSATTTTYVDFSGVSVTSPAVYAGNNAKTSNGAIQLRSKNGNSGIVSTTSGGKLKKIRVIWDGATSADRTLDIYGSSEAFTSASELYNSVKGEKIASIKNGETEVEISGDYPYVGMRSNDGALYLTQIEVIWE